MDNKFYELSIHIYNAFIPPSCLVSDRRSQQLTTENTFGVHSRFGNINDPFFASDVAGHGMYIVLVAFVVKLVGLALDLIQDGTTKGNTILVFAHLLKQTGQSKPQQYGQQIFPYFGRYQALDIDFHMYVCILYFHYTFIVD